MKAKHAACYLLLALSCTVMLSGCASRRQTNAQTLDEQQREPMLRACERFELSGKIAVKQRTAEGTDGGSGRFSWKQDFAELSFDLSAPLSNQTWRLQGVPGSYQLTDAKGKTTHGADAETLIRELSAWTLPVASLQHWVRGLPDAAAEVKRNRDGTLMQLSSNDWSVQYLSYGSTEPKLPARIKATHPNASLTLVIKRWSGCDR